MTTDNANDPPPPRYAGWMRLPRRPWRCVALAQTWEECWDALLSVAPPEGRLATVTRLVLEHGRSPARGG